MGQTASSAQVIVDALMKALPDLIAVYRFGSRVSGHGRRDSDLDLAILCPRSLPSWRRYALQQDLAGLLRQDVDLIDLRSVSTVMQMQVISTGEILLTRDEGVRASFEVYVFSAYARLNEERHGILADVLARGTVYGG